MNKDLKQQGISIMLLCKLIMRNIFSTVYFMVSGLLIGIIYSQFILKPSYVATGTIDNISSQGIAIMTSVSNFVTEHETVDLVIDKLNIESNMVASKKSEILNNLSSSYSSSTFKVIVTYRGSSNEETAMIVEYVIDSTLERFIDKNPSISGKIIKQSDPIESTITGLSVASSLLVFSFGGVIFGTILNLSVSLFLRKIYFESDLQEYDVPYNIMYLSKKKLIAENINQYSAISEQIPALHNKVEASINDKKIKIIAITNQGEKSLIDFGVNYSEKLSKLGFKVLLIDFDFDNPLLNILFDVKDAQTVNTISETNSVAPIKINDYFFVIASERQENNSHLFKNQKIIEFIQEISKKFDYVILNIPPKTYYAYLSFNFEIIDILVVNTQFNFTSIKTLDKYLNEINYNSSSKIFINSIKMNK